MGPRRRSTPRGKYSPKEDEALLQLYMMYFEESPASQASSESPTSRDLWQSIADEINYRFHGNQPLRSSSALYQRAKKKFKGIESSHDGSDSDSISLTEEPRATPVGQSHASSLPSRRYPASQATSSASQEEGSATSLRQSQSRQNSNSSTANRTNEARENSSLTATDTPSLVNRRQRNSPNNSPLRSNAILLGEGYGNGEQILGSTKLLDLTFDKIPCLRILGQGCNFAPKHGILNDLRLIFTRILKDICDNGDRDETSYRRLFLLPYIFFNTRDKGTLRRYLKLLSNDDGWNNLTVQDLIDSHKINQGHKKFTRSEELVMESTEMDPSTFHKTVRSLVQAGALSKAMSRLSDNSEVLEDSSSDNILQLLRSKHPSYSQQELLELTAIKRQLASILPVQQGSQERQQQATVVRDRRDNNALHQASENNGSQTDNNSLFCDAILVTMDELRDIVIHLPDGRAPGLDFFPVEHLKALMGTRSSQKDLTHCSNSEVDFSTYFTAFINRILAGQIPPGAATYLRSNLLIALPKSKTDIRPIGMGSLYRKVASKVIFKAALNFNREKFGDFQYAFRSSGMEVILHEFELLKYAKPEWDIFTIDADNAFNNADRIKGLCEVRDNFPQAFPFLRSMYLYDSCQYCCMDGIVHNIPSLKGFHQGDVLGTWCYVMTIQPLLQALHNHLENKFGENKCRIMFFVDDGNLCGEHEVIVEAVSFLKTNGPQYGYNIKPNKGAYLVGKCESVLEAIDRFEMLTSANGCCNLNADIVKLHPDNVSDLLLYDQQEAPIELPDKYRNMSQIDSKLRYGTKLLCSYVGSDEFIKHKLLAVIDEWRSIANRLVLFPFYQERMILFRKCFSMKPMHLFRTLSCNLTAEFLSHFTTLQVEILESMFERQLDNQSIMDWFCLPFARGGLGILNYKDVHQVAHIASVFTHKSLRESYLILMNNLPHNPSISLDGFIGNLHVELNSLKACLDLPNDANDEAIVSALQTVKKAAVEKYRCTFQQALYVKKSVNREDDIIASFSGNNAAYTQSIREFKLKTFHFKSLHCESSGKWLQVYPSNKEDMKMSNREFSINLNFRYLLDIPCISQCIVYRSETQCPYCHQRNKQATVDKTGHHFICGCVKDSNLSSSTNKASKPGAHFHTTHNFLRKKLFQCCKHALAPSIEEPRNIQLEAGVRPDIVSHVNGSSMAIDLTIVTSYEGVQSGILKEPTDAELQHTDERADRRANEKIQKYSERCNTLGYQFVPFVLYTNGRLHKDADKFLDKLAKEASERRKVPASTIKNYYLKLLSVCLAKRIAYIISTKTYGWQTNNTNLAEVYRLGNQQAYDVGNAILDQ